MGSPSVREIACDVGGRREIAESRLKDSRELREKYSLGEK